MRGKWTEGPWKVECGDHTHRFVLVTDSDDRTIYYKYGAGTAKAADQDEANARLIAAAPALYEALEAIADESVFNQQRFAEDTDTDYFLRCFKAVKERARAALSLAHTEPSQGEK